jgi:glycosyltransferase involved in cell wall biosynthesis
VVSDKHSIYICYFGLREPLVQTQVLPYLRELNKLQGLRVSLLTFEPELRRTWTVDEITRERESLSAEGITWYRLPYHQRPSVLATAYDIAAGTAFMFNLLRREQVDIIHCRVHVPALIGMLARTLSRRKPRILFDIRGFMPEEYTDAGVWPEGGWLYRVAKRIERWLIRESDGFVVLTEKAREILFPESKETGADSFGRPVEVIPCCVDLDRLAGATAAARERLREEWGVTGRRVIVYVGSFGGWYLTDSMLEFFATARRQDPGTFVLVLTQREAGIAERLQELGFGAGDYLVTKAAPAEVPRFLAASDIAISFIKACFSKQSSSPTKIAEYLACGLPIIANRGVGDIDELLEKNNVGILLDGLDTTSFLKAIDAVGELGDAAERSKKVARDEFDLTRVGGERYRRLYTKLLSN